MPILFCNVGWMNKYNGIDGDSINRGGEYNRHATGHEVCNFTNIQGFVFGYVQPVGNSIRIERLGASKKDGKIEDVTVVWTAGPESGGTVVVGWYEEATVYRDLQLIKKPNKLQTKNGLTSYRIKAKANKATLLSIEKRELIIPRAVKGGIGQSNVWFAGQEKSQEIITRVQELIKNGSRSPLPDVDQNESFTEGNPRFVAHLRRERNPTIVQRKKSAVLKATGKLCCEVCGFDFKRIYGEIGDGFCEVHHIHPLHKSDGEVKTKLNDLAIICSNCHRIIHRADPMPNVEAFAKQLHGACA